MDKRSIVIRADWDDEAKVWIATSDDIGLVTESESLQALWAKVPVVIADLLECDAVMSRQEI